jgi:hypothetical protein
MSEERLILIPHADKWLVLSIASPRFCFEAASQEEAAAMAERAFAFATERKHQMNDMPPPAVQQPAPSEPLLRYEQDRVFVRGQPVESLSRAELIEAIRALPAAKGAGGVEKSPLNIKRP